jgi:hypothetical protein
MKVRRIDRVEAGPEKGAAAGVSPGDPAPYFQSPLLGPFS